jgi:hypothetical protein
MAAFLPVSFITATTAARRVAARPLAVFSESSILTAADTLPSGTTFQAVVPETSVLIGFAGILALSVLCAYVWANQVVPVSRAKLAVSKRNGPVKEYLDELRKSGAANENATDNSRAAERWLFTDWLEKPAAKGGRQKEPALPVLKNAKWNSGDNPVLVASALIGAGVIFTSITERIAGAF